MAETQGSTEVRPLHGDYVLSMRISQFDDNRTLATRWRALEWGWYERARTDVETEHNGVRIVDLFEATHLELGDLPTLEEAMALNPMFQRFLLSKAGEDQAVISSRFGYNKGGRVNVLEPKFNRIPGLTVDMFDYPESTYDEHLLDRHLGRVAVLGGNPNQELPQEEADAIFRHMISAAPDRA